MFNQVRFRKAIEWLLYLFIFLLPWQTRWIYREANLGDGLLRGVWEYGRQSLYGLEVIWAAAVVLGIIYAVGSRQYAVGSWRKIFRRENLLPGVMFLLFVWSLITIIWSADKNLAWYHSTIFLEGVVLFFLITSFAKQEKAAVVLVMSAAIQSLLGCYQFMTQYIWGSKWLGMATQTASDLGVSVVEVGDQRWLRAYGSLPHPNMLAAFLVVALILILYLSLGVKNKGQRNFVLLGLLLVIPGLIFTFSRSAWLVGGVAIIYYLIISFFDKKRRAETQLTRQLLVIGFIWTVIISLMVYPLIWGRLTNSSRLDQLSSQSRMALYGQSVDLIKSHWSSGVGMGNYTLAVYQQVDNSFGAWLYQPVHNVYVLVLAELGVVGLLLCLFVICYLVFGRKGNWLVKLPFLALLFLAFFDHSFWSLYFGVTLWWVAAGWGLASSE
ncbi:MAG: O-antigen ligase family protein [Patescibacteria group bacterium]